MCVYKLMSMHILCNAVAKVQANFWTTFLGKKCLIIPYIVCGYLNILCNYVSCDLGFCIHYSTGHNDKRFLRTTPPPVLHKMKLKFHFSYFNSFSKPLRGWASRLVWSEMNFSCPLARRHLRAVRTCLSWIAHSAFHMEYYYERLQGS